MKLTATSLNPILDARFALRRYTLQKSDFRLDAQTFRTPSSMAELSCAGGLNSGVRGLVDQ